MFTLARIKLTAWYLAIIMLISIFFSLVIYVTITRELEHGFRGTGMHFRTRQLGMPLSLRPPIWIEELEQQLAEDLQIAKNRLVINLLIVNGAILVISTLAGYFLAGKTLQPIEVAMDEQKRFVADASHELRTPLTALKTSMEVGLRDKKISSAAAKKLIQSNLEDIDNLQSLSDKLLSLTHFQDNGSHLKFEDININEVIQKAFKKILPLAKEKQIDVKTQVTKQKISADRASLEEMMVIFLDNAVKYTSKGGQIIVSTKSEKKHLIIKISDTGIGIAKKDLPHIFYRFYRADHSRCKTPVSGFGLGLALAKKIIELHKGTVTVSSTLGKGTTFTIKLPQ